MNHILRLSFLVLLANLHCAPSSAATVVWPAVIFDEMGPGSYAMWSDISSSGIAVVEMLLTATAPDAAILSAQTYSAGNVAIWFQTSLNSAVDANAVSSASYFCNPLTGTLGSIDVSLDQVFYVGFLLWGPDEIYGWASLVWDGTTLTLLDSAAETTGVGLFAGTYDPVPEPTAGCLLASGLAALALRRRRRRSKPACMSEGRGFIIGVLLLTFGCHANAANVMWPVAALGEYDESLLILGTETPSGAGAGIVMDLVSVDGVMATLSAQNFTAGVGHIWFQTNVGTAIDATAVTSAEPFLNAFTAEMGTFTINLEEVFCLGFYVGGSDFSGAIYGWVSLVWDGTTLTLLDSAYETTGVGLFAGTYDPVPEPTAGCLLAAGLAALALRRRRKRVETAFGTANG